MKKIVWITFLIAATMLLMPLSVLGNQPKVVQTVNFENEQKAETEELSDTFRLYDPKTEKITEISREDYIFGVVAAEMPALYEKEALKAQAVAAYTYACYNREINKAAEYDLSTDPSNSQCFITKAEAKEKWGSKADEYKEKIESVIKETNDYVIKYDGEIILAVYHAISSGKTETSANVWGKDYPYLKSVDSKWDKDSQNYTETVSFTVGEIKKKLGEDIEWGKKAKDYFGKSVLTESGYVDEITVCGKKISGTDIRNKLDLRSACFEVKFKDDKFLITTYGYGHGVGMSQNGANELAKKGKNFKEILQHYYSGCSIESLRDNMH